jgi:hypothetical protein
MAFDNPMFLIRKNIETGFVGIALRIATNRARAIIEPLGFLFEIPERWT